MEIPCFRCGKKLDAPDKRNAYYIMAADTIDTVIEDGQPKDIQKTGIICPDCHQPTDTVIWGGEK